MRALELTATERLEMVERPQPQPAPDEVLIRVRAVGICGSDVHGYAGVGGRRIPPIVMGHELAGEVCAVGDAVSGIGVGDRVVPDSTIWCGTCPACRTGRVNLCERRRVLGVSAAEYRQHGAFAEYIAVPHRIVYPLPDSVSFEYGAMVEPLAVATHAVAISPIALGSSVMVIGAGVIGQFVHQVARSRGATYVVVSDLSDDRLQLATRLGADEVHRPTEGAASPATDARFDVVFDCVGAAATLAASLASVKPGGCVTLVGNLTPEAPFAAQYVVTREIRVQGSCAVAGEYPAAIDLIRSGAVDPGPLISATAPLEEGPGYFARLHARDASLVKVILVP